MGLSSKRWCPAHRHSLPGRPFFKGGITERLPVPFLALLHLSAADKRQKT
jgi:hypothetical protein